MRIHTKLRIDDALGLGQSKAQVKQLIENSKQTGMLIEQITAVILTELVDVNIELIDQEGIRNLLNDDEARDTTDNL